MKKYPCRRTWRPWPWARFPCLIRGPQRTRYHVVVYNGCGRGCSSYNAQLPTSYYLVDTSAPWLSCEWYKYGAGTVRLRNGHGALCGPGVMTAALWRTELCASGSESCLREPGQTQYRVRERRCRVRMPCLWQRRPPRCLCGGVSSVPPRWMGQRKPTVDAVRYRAVAVSPKHLCSAGLAGVQAHGRRRAFRFPPS